MPEKSSMSVDYSARICLIRVAINWNDTLCFREGIVPIYQHQFHDCSGYHPPEFCAGFLYG